MYYGLYGKLVAKPGLRDAVAAVLTRGVDELTAYGCMLYIVSLDSEHPDVIWVTEVWKSAEGHAASLESPSVKKAIAEGVKYGEARGVVEFEATDSASEKIEYIYRLLVHDKVIQPLPEDQVSQQSMKHKLAIWASKLK